MCVRRLEGRRLNYSKRLSYLPTNVWCASSFFKSVTYYCNMQSPTTAWSSDKKYSDRERWVCIYPAFINSKKTLASGRRVPKSKAVDNPTCQEIKDVLSASSGFKFGVENKLYPREGCKELTHRGRIRVQLKDDDGTLLNPDFPTRESVMLYLCTMIPKLKTRQFKPGGEQGQAAGSSKKKGGKGRR